MRIEKGATPINQINRVNLIATIAVFVVAPALVIWWLKSYLPVLIWWFLLPLYVLWLLHLFSFESSEIGSGTAVQNDLDATPGQPFSSPPVAISAPSVDRDARPWQERVEEIERNRPRSETTVSHELLFQVSTASQQSEPGQHARPPVDHELHEYLQLLIDAGEWDAARSALQKVAYTMPDASVEERLAFAGYVKDFAALDPLFNRVLSIVLPAVQAQPGIKQTAVYALVPDLDKETTRYVLYYAHVLALIERKKKGSTYQLFPFVEGVSERWEEALSRKLAAADKSEPTHKQIRAEMWARRLPQLQQSIERRPYWQFRAAGDLRDPPACKALDGRVERYDSAFWQTKAPWKCRRLECRCTVRAYSREEMAAKAIPIPD
jgi:protein involved in temperature-dependent protein secretion